MKFFNVPFSSLFLISMCFRISKAADTEIPPDRLALIKSACVLVRFVDPEPIYLQGGFVYLSRNDSVYIVTPAGAADKCERGKPVATVLFNPGEKNERWMKGDIVAWDRKTDLAVIKVTGKDLPKPIPASTAVLTPKKPAYVHGFPYAQSQTLPKQTYQLRTAKALVTELRENPPGIAQRLSMTVPCDIQSGKYECGRNGSAITDEKGDLVAVFNQNCGDLPVSELGEIFKGSILAYDILGDRFDGASVTAGVNVCVFDPLQNIENVSLLWVERSRVRNVPQPRDGVFPPLAEATQAKPILINRPFSHMSFEVKGVEDQTIEYIAQLKYDRLKITTYGPPFFAKIKFEKQPFVHDPPRCFDGSTVQQPAGLEKVAKLKRSAVVVQSQTNQLFSEGAGFVYNKFGKQGYVLTSAHAVKHAFEPAYEVKLFFDVSEHGARELSGTVIAVDPNYNLAVVAVTADDLPEPMTLAPRTENRKIPVLVVGPEFSENLFESHSNSQNLVVNSFVSNPQVDPDGDVSSFILPDANGQAGMGSVIINEDDQVVGMAIGAIPNTRDLTAISVNYIKDLMKGSICHCAFNTIAKHGNTIDVEAKVLLFDPFERIDKIRIMGALKSDVKQMPGIKNGSCEPLIPASEWVTVKLKRPYSIGTFQLRGTIGAISEYLTQFEISRKKKSTLFQPQKCSFSFDNNPVQPVRKKTIAGVEIAELPKASVVNASRLKSSIKTKDGFSVSEFTISPQGLVNFWISNDGKRAYFYEGAVLRTFSIPDLAEKNSVILDGDFCWAAQSKEVIVAAHRDHPDILLFDPITLNAVDRLLIPVFNSQCTVNSRNNLMFAMNENRGLNRIDLATKKLVGTLRQNGLRESVAAKKKDGNVSSIAGTYVHPRLTPDGKFVLCIDDDCVNRINVSENAFTWEESAPPHNCSKMTLSDDGKFVALGTDKDSTVIDIYEVNNLKKPAFSLDTGDIKTYCMAFDCVNQKVYVCGEHTHLQVYDYSGKKLNVYDPLNATITRIAIDPTGARFLAIAKQGIFLVAMPNK